MAHAFASPTATNAWSFDEDLARLDLRRSTIDRWSDALVRGDGAEVERLVRQGRIDRGQWSAVAFLDDLR
jgi:hypothetical protein